MPSVPFAIHHGAFSGYMTLTPEERAAIQAAIDPLVDRPEQEWTAHGAIRLGSPKPFYLLKIDPSLRRSFGPRREDHRSCSTSSAMRPSNSCSETRTRCVYMRSLSLRSSERSGHPRRGRGRPGAMKIFERLDFNLAQCHVEVGELRDWLDANPTLGEKSIRVFFRRRRHLSAFIASYNPNVNRFDRIAFEYPLFGDFTCDLVVGDSDGSRLLLRRVRRRRPSGAGR